MNNEEVLSLTFHYTWFHYTTIILCFGTAQFLGNNVGGTYCANPPDLEAIATVECFTLCGAATALRSAVPGLRKRGQFN